MPPHQTGIPAASQTSCRRLASPKSAHAPQLDIDDAAGLQADRLLGVVRGANAFIETDRRFKLRLQHGVVDDVVVRQRLLDHHQVELVELLQQGASASV
jgi:hypothetical protein